MIKWLRLSKAQASLALHSACTLILIITGLYFNCFILQRLLGELRLVALAFVLPATYVEEVLVIALSLAFLGLILLAEVTTARLITREGVESYELTHGEEVAEVDSLVELDVQTFLRSRNEQVGVELLLQLVHLLQTSLQALSGATHTHVLPHDVAEFLVDRVNGALTLDVQQTILLLINLLLSLSELRQIGRDLRPDSLVGQIVLDGVRQHEVTIGQTLHQRRSTQTVGTVVREVTLTDSEQTRDSGLQLVVNPDTTHGVVDSGIDHHRLVVLYAVDLVGNIARQNKVSKWLKVLILSHHMNTAII